MTEGSRRSSGRRLTPEEQERIIALRLSGVAVRQVATEIPTTTKTVVDTFKRYLGERAVEFAAETDQERAKILSRLERIADSAAHLAQHAEKEGDRARAMGEERQALAAMAKLLGLEVQKVEHSGDTGFTVLRIVEQVDVEGKGS